MKQKGRKNLTYTQRLQIETLFNTNHKPREIAQIVGVSERTIYRELRRGEYVYDKQRKTFWYDTKYKKVKSYSAQIAQERYEIACTARGRTIKLGNDYEFVNYLTKRVLEDKVSVGAALGEIKHKNLQFKTDVCVQTVYSYIEKGYIPNLRLEKPKRRYKKVLAKRPPRGTSIEQRPEEILLRKEFGHWEMDLVIGKTKVCLLVLTERMTRREIIFKIKNKTTASVVQCLNTLERRYKDRFHAIFKTITVDNGTEFSDFEGMEKSTFGEYKRVKIFYCHPYSSYERGTNERINRDIRRQIPKGSDISKYSVTEIQKVEDWLNNYPRKIFGHATPAELFAEQMKLLL